MPEKQVPHGSWLIAAGIILLSLNAIRYFNGIRMRGFSLFAGIVGLIMGFGQFFGVELPLLANALIVIGVGMLLKTMTENDSIFPTATVWRCCGGRHTGNQDRAGQAVRR